MHIYGYRIHMVTAYIWLPHTYGYRIHMVTAYMGHLNISMKTILSLSFGEMFKN